MRIVPQFRKKVKVPPKYRKYLWEYPDAVAPLETFLLRTLSYGKFEDIKWLYKNYPAESYYVATTYPQIHRGVKFWIRYWKNGNGNV